MSQWDLSELYASPDDPAIEDDKRQIETLTQNIEAYRGTIASLSAQRLRRLIGAKEALFAAMHKLGVYAGLLAATNSGVDAITRFEKGIDEFLTNIHRRIVFVGVELKPISDETWRRWQSAKILKPYALTLAHWQRDARHTLSEPEEQILVLKSQTSWQALVHLFDVTTDTLEITFNGQTKTVDEVTTLLRHPESPTRRRAAMALHEGLKANNKTTHAIFNALIHDKTIDDRLRGYTYPEQGRFDEDDVDRDTVETMAGVVEQSSTVADYYAAKKKLLQTDKLMWWDRYAPLPRPAATFTQQQATDLVLKSFEQFSGEFMAAAEKVIAANHIDWLPSPTKRGGAFCSYGAHRHLPYILLNFTGTYESVNTLAHELGHAVHDVISGQHNSWLNVWPSLALAEVASTFAEELLFDAVMSQPNLNRDDRVSLLMGRIEGHLATIHRQVSMFRFEQLAHAERLKKGELAKDELDTLWQETIQKPFGDSVEWTDEHKNFWMYISHFFHTPFYVYSYAFAQLISLSLYNLYKTAANKKEFVQLYLNILAAGGSRTPREILIGVGIDISTPAFWRGGLKIIEADIAALKRLA